MENKQLNNINKYKPKLLLQFYLLFFVFCILSISRARQKLTFPYFETIISIFVIINVLNLIINIKYLIKTTAIQYSLTYFYAHIALCIITFSTSIRVFYVIGFQNYYFFILNGVLIIFGMIVQFINYKKYLLLEIPEFIKNKKIEISSEKWNINIKTTYKPRKIETKLNKIMKKISFLSYFAPALGFYISKYKNFTFNMIFIGILMMFFSISFTAFSASTMGELYLINEINKKENIDLKIN